MRREEVVDGALAAALVPLALAVALPFRREAMAAQTVFSLGWDAALHATEGLDLFDDLRLLRPLDALRSPPEPALVGAALGARERSIPGGVRAIASRREPAEPRRFRPHARRGVSPRPPARSGRPPRGGRDARSSSRSCSCDLRCSSRPPRGPCSRASAAFSRSSRGFSSRCVPRAAPQRAAFLAGAALFLLKYHFGFFVLGTFLAVVLVEETPDARRRLGAAARALLAARRGRGNPRSGGGSSPRSGCFSRRAGETPSPLALPSVPNVAWGAFVLFVLLGAARRRTLSEAWVGASATFRDLVVFGLLPVARVVPRSRERARLVPADLPAHGRARAKPAREAGGVLELSARRLDARRRARLVLVLAGPPSRARPARRDRTRRALASFALWPVLLMSLNAYPVEARFLACLVPALFAAAVAGLSALAACSSRKGAGARARRRRRAAFPGARRGALARRARRARRLPVRVRPRGDRGRERGRRGRAAERARSACGCPQTLPCGPRSASLSASRAATSRRPTWTSSQAP